MKKRYSKDWLIQLFESGETLQYIFFWGHTSKDNEKTGKFCLSQWFESPFTVGGVTYKTAEHWMMAQKALLFNDHKSFDKIIHADTPAEAKKLGRDITGYDDQTWNDKKYAIVRLGNIHKFNQDPALADYLFETENKILVEASPVDIVWGIGLAQDNSDIDNIYAWQGENLLGFALMEARDFLKEFGLFTVPESAMQPPWIQFPGIDPHDMFWRMGIGENYLTDFSKYYLALSIRDQLIYKLTNPTTGEWADFFD